MEDGLSLLLVFLGLMAAIGCLAYKIRRDRSAVTAGFAEREHDAAMAVASTPSGPADVASQLAAHLDAARSDRRTGLWFVGGGTAMTAGTLLLRPGGYVLFGFGGIGAGLMAIGRSRDHRRQADGLQGVLASQHPYPGNPTESVF